MPIVATLSSLNARGTRDHDVGFLNLLGNKKRKFPSPLSSRQALRGACDGLDRRVDADRIGLWNVALTARLSPIELHHQYAVIDIRAERILDGLQVGPTPRIHAANVAVGSNSVIR